MILEDILPHGLPMRPQLIRQLLAQSLIPPRCLLRRQILLRRDGFQLALQLALHRRQRLFTRRQRLVVQLRQTPRRVRDEELVLPDDDLDPTRPLLLKLSDLDLEPPDLLLDLFDQQRERIDRLPVTHPDLIRLPIGERRIRLQNRTHHPPILSVSRLILPLGDRRPLPVPLGLQPTRRDPRLHQRQPDRVRTPRAQIQIVRLIPARIGVTPHLHLENVLRLLQSRRQLLDRDLVGLSQRRRIGRHPRRILHISQHRLEVCLDGIETRRVIPQQGIPRLRHLRHEAIPLRIHTHVRPERAQLLGIPAHHLPTQPIDLLNRRQPRLAILRPRRQRILELLLQPRQLSLKLSHLTLRPLQPRSQRIDRDKISDPDGISHPIRIRVINLRRRELNPPIHPIIRRRIGAMPGRHQPIRRHPTTDQRRPHRLGAPQRDPRIQRLLGLICVTPHLDHPKVLRRVEQSHQISDRDRILRSDAIRIERRPARSHEELIHLAQIVTNIGQRLGGMRPQIVATRHVLHHPILLIRQQGLGLVLAIRAPGPRRQIRALVSERPFDRLTQRLDLTDQTFARRLILAPGLCDLTITRLRRRRLLHGHRHALPIERRAVITEANHREDHLPADAHAVIGEEIPRIGPPIGKRLGNPLVTLAIERRKIHVALIAPHPRHMLRRQAIQRHHIRERPILPHRMQRTLARLLQLLGDAIDHIDLRCDRGLELLDPRPRIGIQPRINRRRTRIHGRLRQLALRAGAIELIAVEAEVNRRELDRLPHRLAVITKQERRLRPLRRVNLGDVGVPLAADIREWDVALVLPHPHVIRGLGGQLIILRRHIPQGTVRLDEMQRALARHIELTDPHRELALLGAQLDHQPTDLGLDIAIDLVDLHVDVEQPAQLAFEAAQRRLNPAQIPLLELIEEAFEPRADLIDRPLQQSQQDLLCQLLRRFERLHQRLLSLLGKRLDGILRLLNRLLDRRPRILIQRDEAILGVLGGRRREVHHPVDHRANVVLDLARDRLEPGLGVVDQTLDRRLRRPDKRLPRSLEFIDDILDARLASLDVCLALAVDHVIDQLADVLELRDELLGRRDHVRHDARSESQRELHHLEDRSLGDPDEHLALHLELRHIGINDRLEVGLELLSRLLHLLFDLRDRLFTLLTNVRDDRGVFFIVVIDELLLGLGVGLVTHLLQITRLLLGLALELVLGDIDLLVQLGAQVFDRDLDAFVDFLEANVERLLAGPEDLIRRALHLVERALAEAKNLIDHVIDRPDEPITRLADERKAILDDLLDRIAHQIGGITQPLLEISEQILGELLRLGQRLFNRRIDLLDDAFDGLTDLLRQCLERGKQLIEGVIDRRDGFCLDRLDPRRGAVEDGLEHLGRAVFELGQRLVQLGLDLFVHRLTGVRLGELRFDLLDDDVELLGQCLAHFLDLTHQPIELLIGHCEQLVFDGPDLALDRRDLRHRRIGDRVDLTLHLFDERILDRLDLLLNRRRNALSDAKDRVDPGIGRLTQDRSEREQRGLDRADRGVDAGDDLGLGRLHLLDEPIERALRFIDDAVRLALQIGERLLGRGPCAVDALSRASTQLRRDALLDFVFAGRRTLHKNVPPRSCNAAECAVLGAHRPNMMPGNSGPKCPSRARGPGDIPSYFQQHRRGVPRSASGSTRSRHRHPRHDRGATRPPLPCPSSAAGREPRLGRKRIARIEPAIRRRDPRESSSPRGSRSATFGHVVETRVRPGLAPAKLPPPSEISLAPKTQINTLAIIR